MPAKRCRQCEVLMAELEAAYDALRAARDDRASAMTETARAIAARVVAEETIARWSEQIVEARRAKRVR